MTMNLIDALAEVCHEAKRAYLVEQGFDNPAWANASSAVRYLAVAEVERCLFSDLTPEQHHSVWLEQHKGWTRADVEDADAKESPLVAPWSELGLNQRACWAISHAIVKTIGAQTS